MNVVTRAARARRSAAWGTAAGLVILAACSIGAPSDTQDRPDASPIEVKEPDDDSSTARGCEGVTEVGECREGVAVSCDTAAGELQRVDCAALGERCLVDFENGVGCAPEDEEVPACGDGLDLDGYCDGEQARWCDARGENVWDCAEAGLTCAVDACEVGAFCCDAGAGCGGEPDFESACAGERGQTARSCEGGEIAEEDCLAESELSCQVDACEEGAACCEGEAECEALGTEGACAGDVYRFCPDSESYVESDCTEFGRVCDEGEGCQELSCDQIPDEGTCVGDWAVFCDFGSREKINCADQEDGPFCDPDPEDGDLVRCTDEEP